MVKVTYRGSQKTTETQGHSFVNGEPTEIENEAVLSKLSGNRFFEISGKTSKAPAPTNDELKAQLDEAGIEYPSNAKKDELLGLLNKERGGDGD